MDRPQKPIEFEVEDNVVLKISPWIKIVLLVKRGNMSLHCLGLGAMIERCGYGSAIARLAN